MSNLNKKALYQAMATTFSGLVINFPLQFVILYVCIDLLDITSPFVISVIAASVMTITAIIRCYFININFDKRYNGDL